MIDSVLRQNKTINLKPVRATEDIMQMLEDKSLIIRLSPGKHSLDAKEGEIRWEPIYESSDKFGPHKLITVTINTEEWFNFGYHEDNEEFFFIGNDNTKPMYFVVGLISRQEMDLKINDGTLSETDFLVLDMTYNDADISFFTLLKDVPHAELTCNGPEVPPSFYVTESRDLSTEVIDLKEYKILIKK